MCHFVELPIMLVIDKEINPVSTPTLVNLDLVLSVNPEKDKPHTVLSTNELNVLVDKPYNEVVQLLKAKGFVV